MVQPTTPLISKGTAYKAYGDLGNDTIQINSDFAGASSGVVMTVMQHLTMVQTVFRFRLRLPLLTGNGGADTPHIAGKVLADSSVCGGQGSDDISASTTVSAST